MFKLLPKNQIHTGCKRCNYIGCEFETKKYPKFGHWIWTAKFLFGKSKKSVKKFIYNLGALDYSKIDDIELEGIDSSDYPDFSDAYISYATYKGKPMNEKQLDRLNDDGGFVYEQVCNQLY